jgi:mono/diheme cytochrome c family protein
MSCSQSAGFGVMMDGLQRGLEEVVVGRRFASAMILLAALVPPAAHAQVNIDQGKAPAQIYDSDCAACHKSIRGLANGRGASALTSFLSEHYTSSSKEAAALAAYVLGGGGGVGTPAPAHSPKLKPEPTTASAEEPKDRDVKRTAKPEGDQGMTAKPQRPAGSQKPDGTTQKPEGTGQKPEGMQTAVGEPGSAALDRKPVPVPLPARREPSTATPGTGTAGTGTRVRGQPKPVEPSLAAPKPTTVVVAPSAPESPSPGTSPAPPEPSEAQPSAEVPRDNIPD